MTTTVDEALDCREIAANWLSRFDAALTLGSIESEDLFDAGCLWRDIVAFTGDVRTFPTGRIAAELTERQATTVAANFRIAPGHVEPRVVERNGQDCIEAIFAFDLPIGSGIGVVRLVPTADGVHRARNLFTMLDELTEHPERIGANRPTGQADSSKFGGPNWLDRRIAARSYLDHDPQVLIVGGGQTGLALAARLGQLDVDALVIDTHERPGDNWRNRYHALTLHNAIWLNDMPYLPFPQTWPVFVPKDKLAGWFETYVDAMEINFWGGSRFTGAEFDEPAGVWTARIERSDGETRVVHPRHIVLATGVSGIPYVPEVPGLDDFTGDVLHSSSYTDAARYAGKHVVVIGTGNSAHDVAQDLHANGARVTMVQRSSTTVVSIDPSAAAVDESYLTAPTLEDSDLIGLSVPYPDLVTGSQQMTQRIREFDKELIAGLERIGFRTDYGHDDTGQQMKFMRRGGGYYLNVGCSDLLISGEIGLVQNADIDRFVAGGVAMRDGSVLAADAVILATGFHGQQENVRRLMGDAVADAIGPVWGYDDEGELRNMWRPTAQRGLWFSAGNFQMCRTYSKVLALQLRMQLAD
ncbi:flavin-containing monooxygenase [Mycolicibacterium mageritense]|uniref:Ferredoxin--NADP reductase n=1 Tax=Mycolicibacterium mageritense TaxID=53462 RepID=A0AAI8TSE9_MYCME|nr:NAD(P)/FAD-dependent oxidoreductase [Mycolicibacterium mageritense]TXI63366.1 MAG: NAD(P)/FAD-dependent oxidoreductase [Mycolicibacterium mageritense]BDY27692.1 Ferredoxin--NADP reductase [Mycolicibacterium mageritense]